MTAVGGGNLTQKSAREGDDELGRLARSLNQMVAGLRDVASQTRAAIENLNSAAVEILASTKQQAAGTGEQAAACQETNAAIQEVSQSCLQIAEWAKRVAAAAEAAPRSSDSGVEAVQKTKQIVEDIREQSEAVAGNVLALSEKTQQAGDIIATVNDIAEQSHLLALNAAIPIVALTAHGSQEAKERSMEAGCSAMSPSRLTGRLTLSQILHSGVRVCPSESHRFRVVQGRF